MKQENFFTANQDLLFTFDNAIPWSEIVPLVEEGFRDPTGPADTAEAVDLYREALTLVGQYAGNEIAGRAREVDEAGARHRDGPIGVPELLTKNVEGLKELGVAGLSIPRAYGGESFPFTVSSMALEMISRACASTMVQYAFFLSPAMMLMRFAPEDLRRRYVPRLAAGEISGSVAMTEPQAGSDVGRVATTARQVDGEWSVTGRKQFITNGSGDICIILARSEEGSIGLDGLSLFLVERQRQENSRTVDNYVVERAENKICITASVTCGLAFEDSKAELLGRRGEGWREILTFMNESRVAVGVQGIGTAQAALEEAKAYAAERVQMGKPIREHPLIADMLLDMEATVAGLRALAYEATALYDATEGMRREAEKLPEGEPRRVALEKTVRRRGRYLRELTPLVKWYGAEEVIRVCRMAMQVYGGYGVVKDYDVERLMRDSLILPIYEGTSQIQSLMATKDLLKAALSRPATLAGGTLSPSLAAAAFPGELGKLYRRARSDLNSSIRTLLYDMIKRGGARGVAGMIQGKPAIKDEDTQYILLHAERLTAMLAHLHVARLLADQAQRFPDRLPLAKRAMRRAAQVTASNAFAIKSGDRSALEVIAEWERPADGSAASESGSHAPTGGSQAPASESRAPATGSRAAS
jgi:alkylation response protein AidB-like acyl-CoA dehydrogenase